LTQTDKPLAGEFTIEYVELPDRRVPAQAEKEAILKELGL